MPNSHVSSFYVHKSLNCLLFLKFSSSVIENCLMVKNGYVVLHLNDGQMLIVTGTIKGNCFKEKVMK